MLVEIGNCCWILCCLFFWWPKTKNKKRGIMEFIQFKMQPFPSPFQGSEWPCQCLPCELQAFRTVQIILSLLPCLRNFDIAATKASCRLLGKSDDLLPVSYWEWSTLQMLLLSRHTKAELTQFLAAPLLASRMLLAKCEGTRVASALRGSPSLHCVVTEGPWDPC